METSYCFFEIDQCRGAVNAAYVEEVLSLPELVLIPNAPLGVIGVLDLRGDTLPVVELQLNHEAQTRSYQLSDSIIVLKQADLRMGIIVSSVQGIREFNTQGLVSDLSPYQESSNLNLNRFFAGVVADESNIFILNAPQNWFKASEIQQVISVTRFLVDDFYDAQASQEQAENQRSEENPTMIFAPTATPEEQATFRQRAENLRPSLEEKTATTESRALVTVSLDGNLFGIDSGFVREFITINQATPVPCCPKHIIGAINLRGEILTIVDIAKPLGLSSKDVSRLPKAIVVEFQETLTAIIVEDIRDALFAVNPNDIQKVTDNSSVMMSNYVQGTVPYGEKPMQILDLPMLLNSNELVVNEIL